MHTQECESAWPGGRTSREDLRELEPVGRDDTLWNSRGWIYGMCYHADI
jgi:hypothetical protein